MRTILFLVLMVISTLSSYSQCLNCQDYGTEQQIYYSVTQPNCGTCSYTVSYKECISQPGIFLIDSIAADNNNPLCCQGTAINDPMVSGYILDEAANQIAQEVGGTITIYTPSKCWKWEGHLGPDGFHTAVLVTCSNTESCCIYKYSGGILQSRTTYGIEDCRAIPCMPLCE